MKKQMYRVVNADKDLQFDKSSSKKDPEEKQYLICIASIPGSEYEDEWTIVTGRRAAYEKIVESIEYIDLENSFILVETCTLKDRKSIYTFMKYMENFYNEGFDIEDYVRGDWSEQEYRHHNDIDQDYVNAINSSNGVTMEDIMNGINITPLEGGGE